MPAEVIELLAYLFSEILDGRNAHVTDGVERALSRPPRDFADYTRATGSHRHLEPGEPGVSLRSWQVPLRRPANTRE